MKRLVVVRGAELDGLDGIVLPGGESTTIDKLLRAFDLSAPLRSALRAGMPAYGSCAGMILLATTVLDGRPDQRSFSTLPISVRRNGFGRQVDSFETDLAVAGLDKPSRLMSSEYDLAYVAEATELHEDDWESLTTRLRNGVMPYQQVIADCNPDAPTHWLWLRGQRGVLSLLHSRHEDNPTLWRSGEWTEAGLVYLARLDQLGVLNPETGEREGTECVDDRGLVHEHREDRHDPLQTSRVGEAAEARKQTLQMLFAPGAQREAATRFGRSTSISASRAA